MNTTKKQKNHFLLMTTLRSVAIMMLMTIGITVSWAADGITTMNYSTDFSSSIEPFDAGEIASGTNVSGVLRVKNTTATARFANVHKLNSNETVTLSFFAYHGWYSNSKTSKVAIYNSDNVELISYTYTHNTCEITDVSFGGNKASGFTAFNAQSYKDNSTVANGLSNNPYNASTDYTPHIWMSVKGDGNVQFVLWRATGSLWKGYNSQLAGVTMDLASIKIISNCDNEDRTICIDNLSIWNSYSSNDYESGVMDWTTSVSGRYDPVILEENGNHYMSVDQDKRSSANNNNGATLTSTNLGVVAGSSYQLTFDLKVSSSNGANSQSGTKFIVYDADNNGEVFSLQATAVGATSWILNGESENPITLPNTSQGTNDITTVPWYSVTILRNGTNTWVTIKDSGGNAIVNNKYVTSSNIGGLGRMQFNTMRYNANFAIDNVFVSPILDWSVASTTIDITAVGNTNPNKSSSLPYVHSNYNTITSRTSSNTNVASFWNDGNIHIKGLGTTTLTLTDVSGYTATTTLTVTGTQVTPTQTANTLTFDTQGYIVNNASNTASNYTLSTGLGINFGYSGETSFIVRNGSYNVLKIIDANGFSHPNLASSGLPYEGIYGGTFVKLSPTNSGYLTVTGNVSTANTKLYNSTGTQIDTDIDEDRHTLSATLTGGTIYFLYNQRTSEEEAAGIYTSLVNSISFANPLFVSSTAVIEIPSDGNYTIPAVGNMTPTSYTLTPYGDLAGAPLTASGGIISGINAGGAILVELSDGTSTAYHLVTVAYKATTYPGHFWNFNLDGEYMTTPEDLKTAPVPTTTITASDNNSWTALYKVSTGNYTRAPEWRLNRRIENDNAVVVPETAGLLFSAKNQGFYLRNDNETFRHIGIHNRVATDGVTFTIPYLKAGDIVELNWKHDAGGSGTTFSATNLTDLRYKPITENFEITESAYRSQFSNPGWYSFIVKEDGHVSFTLQDNGYTDILSIRIYNGGYQPTMRHINSYGNVPAATTMLLDNAEQGYTYNYCNQLNSTATGPAIYVLKGYRSGVDNVECVTGTNAAHWPTTFVDDDATYPAYPVDADETARLYELRKNLIGFRMFNQTWQSTNNSYNNGHIQATSGWGKVTIRMNNYTNDMKYVIGYTPDYTLTIGSKPHQEYPYTWDFTHISAQNVTGAATNVYNSIVQNGGSDEYYDEYTTNWEELTSAKYALKTDNSGPLGSQYVPGAVLVTTNRALSKFKGASSSVYALDEFDGLGFEGQIAFGSDNTINTTTRSISCSRSGGVVSLLSMQVDNYIDKTTDEDGIVIGGTFNHSSGEELSAGNGKVVFGAADKFELSPVASCGFGFKSDGDVGSSKYVLLKPSRPFQVGDVISIKAYATSNPSGSDYGLALYQLQSSGHVTSLYLGAKQKNVEVTLSYTVTDGDNLVGKNSVYVFRANDKSTYITEAEIVGEPLTLNASQVNTWLYSAEDVTITIPDLNADGKQDWIYISSSAAPTAVTNATLVISGTDGPDANQSPEIEDGNARVYKYKVDAVGNAYVTFAAGTRIYIIGVTHILKEIHPVGGTGWATEIRNQDIDHELTGYFTKNDVNAYTVKYDSYDLNTATVALTPINEDGYVPKKTGIVMRLDNASGLTDANSGKNVPLFYPSYTRPASSTPVDFPDNNLMYQDANGIDDDNMNGNETYKVGEVWYQKFILTNIHWAFHRGTTTDDEQDQYKEEDAAGFYRMHIWGTDADKNVMPAHTAFMLVPENQLPVAVWRQAAGTRNNTIGIRDGEDGGLTDINEIKTADRAGYSAHDIDDDGLWYTLSGMKLSGPPTKAGIYIHHHRKVVIK